MENIHGKSHTCTQKISLDAKKKKKKFAKEILTLYLKTTNVIEWINKYDVSCDLLIFFVGISVSSSRF